MIREVVEKLGRLPISKTESFKGEGKNKGICATDMPWKERSRKCLLDFTTPLAFPKTDLMGRGRWTEARLWCAGGKLSAKGIGFSKLHC